MTTLKGATILVVEDNDGIAELLRYSLTDDGVATVHATTGADALQMLDQGCRPDLLLLDLRLPDMDAGALVAEALARGFQIPALLISGWPNAAATAEEHGLPFLEKPFDLDELTEMLSGMLSAQHHPATSVLGMRSEMFTAEPAPTTDPSHGTGDALSGDGGASQINVWTAPS